MINSTSLDLHGFAMAPGVGFNMFRLGRILVFLSVVMGAAPLRAQGPQLGITQPGPGVSEVGTGRLLLGGVVGGAAGVGAAVLIYQVAGGGDTCGDDPCGLYYGLLAGIVFEPIAVPLGVHLANNQRGNYVVSLLASVALGGAVWLGGSQLGLGDELIVLVPVAQLAGAILGEQRSERHQ
jgi:hypothetical protein